MLDECHTDNTDEDATGQETESPPLLPALNLSHGMVDYLRKLHWVFTWIGDDLI
jgi:hypothetical protein